MNDEATREQQAAAESADGSESLASSCRNSKNSLWLRLKEVWRHYSTSITGLALYFLILGYPAIVNSINGVPQQNQLTWVSGKVVFAQYKHPSIRLELDDGTKRDFDFYADLSTIARSITPVSAATKEELTQLAGKRAELGVVPIRWLLYPHNDRVWEVRSSSGFSLIFDRQAQRAKNHTQRTSWITNTAHVLCLAFLIFIFNFERKKKWQLQ